MPKNGSNALKRAIRARMAETGEPYTVARKKILEAQSERPTGAESSDTPQT